MKCQRLITSVVLSLSMGLTLTGMAGELPTTRQSDDEEVRQRILKSWIQMCIELLNPPPPIDLTDWHRVAPSVVREVLTSHAPDSMTVLAALKALPHLKVEPGSFSELIRPHLQSKTQDMWGFRAAAAEALGAVGVPADAPALVPLLDDEDMSGLVQLHALFALGQIGTEREARQIRAWRDRLHHENTVLLEGRRRLADDAIRQIEARAGATTRPATQPTTRPGAPSP